MRVFGPGEGKEILDEFPPQEAPFVVGGRTVGQVCQKLGISGQTYHRWRNQYGGMKADAMKRLKKFGGGEPRPGGMWGRANSCNRAGVRAVSARILGHCR